MRLLRILTIFLLAAAVMLGCMLWVAQFFTGQGESTPVIWLEKMREEGDQEQEDFAEFEDEDDRP